MIKCCICLERKDTFLSCKHCSEGHICKVCAPRVIEECSTCPVCRQTNWHSNNEIILKNKWRKIKNIIIDWLFIIFIVCNYFLLSGVFGYLTLLTLNFDFAQFTIPITILLALLIGISETVIICSIVQNM